jgi:hypothetical protein
VLAQGAPVLSRIALRKPLPGVSVVSPPDVCSIFPQSVRMFPASKTSPATMVFFLVLGQISVKFFSQQLFSSGSDREFGLVSRV